jgi:hypothetical protein
MSEPITITTLLGTVASVATLQFLVSLWLTERFKASLQRENGAFLESLRWEMRVREQAAKVAEYMALVRDLGDSSTPEEYRRANQLAWELALWLPAETYRTLSKALTAPSEEVNALSVVAEVRRLLLEGRFGLLAQHEVLVHAPGIGRFRSIAEQR